MVLERLEGDLYGLPVDPERVLLRGLGGVLGQKK